ncbi:MAG: hypothetical protein IKC74_02415 [Clostridia bacterium]|nr:hypothetical protein [Clostridia bacterium]
MFSFVNSYHYDYESEKNKVLIINPCSDRVLTYHGKKTIEIDNGESIGDYKVFTATAFLNALERECLDL